MQSLIAGFGEVGKGLQEVLSNTDEVFFVDKDGKVCGGEIGQIDVLHICFPYSDKFVCEANKYIKRFKPILTIVHSTVPVGVTRCLKGARVHSPIRGKHPSMATGIRAYPKLVGYDTQKEYDLATKYFSLTPINFIMLKKPETTELAKILSLVRYGMGIAFTNSQEKICNKLGLEFSDVVNMWESTLNAGHNRVGSPQLCRPIYSPLKGKIGGHCVIPVTKMAKDIFHKFKVDESIPDFILKFS